MNFFPIRSFLLLAALFCGSPVSAAESVSEAALSADFWLVRTWQTDEGLPDNGITDVAQAADGYVWAATKGGLMRFDGVRFEEFSTIHSPKMPKRIAQKIFMDRKGSMWLALDRGGVFRIASQATQFFGLEAGAASSHVNVMVEDKEGGLWFGCDNGVFRILSDQTDHFGVAEGWTAGGNFWLAADVSGQMWLACGSQLGVVRDGQWQTLLKLDSEPVHFVAARAGGLWICTATQVLQFKEGSEPQTVARLPENAEVRVMLEDRTGTLWIGTTANGLLRLRGGKLDRVAVSHPEISALMEDREGNLWVGTAGGGLNLLRPRAMNLITAHDGLPFEPVRSVCQDADGSMWAALLNGSLVRGRDGQWNAVTSAEGWPGGYALCVVPAQGGGIWIGTRDRGLQRLSDGKVLEWGRGEGLDSQGVRSLLPAKNGDVWVVTTKTPTSLQVFRDKQFHSLKMPAGISGPIRALAEGVNGTIWAGCSSGQILRVDGDKIVNEVSAQEKDQLYSVRCLQTTADGSLWIGYAGWGVGRWLDGRYTRISTAQGLRDDYISQMLFDGHDDFWLTGNRGLFRVRLDELASVAEGLSEHLRCIAYGRQDGLPSLQPVFDNNATTCKSANDQLWFATRNGLLLVQPDKIRGNPFPPPVRLQEVKVDDRLVAMYGRNSPLRPLNVSDEARLTDLGTGGESLKLPPRHSKIEFAFTALSFNSPENVQFRHRLNGFDVEWIDDGPQRSVKYPSLPPGSYEFEVTACNEAGVWSENGFHLPFVVQPLYWQTWWFRSLLLAGFTVGVIAVVRYVSFRRLRQRMRRLEQQAVLDKERARIAKDLHDDLGASMTQMTLVLELALQQRSEPDTVIGTVQDGLRSAREAIKSLDAAVWAVNPANNTLPELVAYIGQFGMEFLRQANIRCDLDLPEHPPECAVSAELRHSLFLIVKEALNNVVRHAHATEVRLQISITAAALELLIADNGRGIERKPDDTLADGLRNMRQRAEELNAQFQIESAAGAGTKIHVRYPWPPVD